MSVVAVYAMSLSMETIDMLTLRDTTLISWFSVQDTKYTG